MDKKGDFVTREDLLGDEHHYRLNFRSITLLLLVLLIINVSLLNYKLFVSPNSSPSINSAITAQNSEQTPEVSATASAVQKVCDETCIEQFEEQIAALGSGGAQNAPIGSSASGNEFFIPLGAGSINSTDLITITGMQATLDGNAYGNNYTATFEIAVNVPTGNQTANFQLYNLTANHPVWNSNVTFTTGGTPALLISSPIKLDPGNNTYVVQGSTQLQFTANITQARVHIVTD